MRYAGMVQLKVRTQILNVLYRTAILDYSEYNERFDWFDLYILLVNVLKKIAAMDRLVWMYGHC